MDLKIKDVAELFNVSETTVRRWLMDGKIPTYRLENQDRFSRFEIENWIIRHKLIEGDRDSPFAVSEEEDIEEDLTFKGRGSKQYSLYRALHKGNILDHVPGDTKTDVIKAAVKMIASDLNLDADVITDLLLDRENLQPTALNNGIGLPHTRDCFLSAGQDVVTIVFPSKPISYGALDGLPVHTMFFLFACEDKRHLHLLAKIAHLSSQSSALQLLRTKPNKAKFLEFVKEWESRIQQ